MGDRISNVISLEDDKKHADFLNKDHAKNCKVLKCTTHPNLRKGTIGHAAVLPFAPLVRAMS